MDGIRILAALKGAMESKRRLGELRILTLQIP
jgi:hypothetical protein